MATKTYLYKRADGDNTKRAKLVDASDFISSGEMPPTPNEISYGVEHKPLLNFIGDILSDGAKLKLENTNIPTGMDFNDYRWLNFAQTEGTATESQLSYDPTHSDEDELYLRGAKRGYVCIIGYQI